VPTISCLRSQVTSGAQGYPILIGFLPAETILSIAEAPSYTPHTTHQAIATNILTPPIREWQRPLDPERVAGISAFFNNSGRLMPNPVLLSENATSPGGITVRQQLATGGTPTDVWEVDIPEPPTDQPKPLWILDGQHRISGLATSAQKDNSVPLVLLVNDGMASYDGPTLAALFAQVTTSARQLDVLHNEWLTFAFELGDYDPARSGASHEHAAMLVVAELCRDPSLLHPAPNPFCDNIQFNASRSVAPVGGGFTYTCKELQEMLLRGYYGQPVSGGSAHLQPRDVARQLAEVYTALKASVSAPHAGSVFFGDAAHAQKPMQTAFLLAALGRMRLAGVPSLGWALLFDQLAFSTSSWDFTSWVLSLHGREATSSAKIAESVLTRAFVDEVLPPGMTGMPDVLRGNGAELVITASPLKTQTSFALNRGQTTAQNVGSRRHLKMVEVSDNIGTVGVFDRQSPPGNPLRYRLDQGITLNTSTHSNPVLLDFHMQHYGGNESTAQLDISWS
jgi:hypothetical protein